MDVERDDASFKTLFKIVIATNCSWTNKNQSCSATLVLHAFQVETPVASH